MSRAASHADFNTATTARHSMGVRAASGPTRAASPAERRAAVPAPTDAPRFLPWACRELLMPFGIRTLVTQDEPTKADKSCRRKVRVPAISRDPADELEPEVPDDNEIPVNVVVDARDHLLAVQLERVRLALPPQLIQIIALCAPYQPLLARLTVRACNLCPRTFRELRELAAAAHLTEVCLDGSPAPERGYGTLLEAARLRRLSLARCGLDDEDACQMAASLAYPRAAAGDLRVLELVSNAVTDEGARALAAALRSNRTLQYLNLADNRIEDEGAGVLLRALAAFPLAADELLATRRRRLARERLLRDETQRILNETNWQAPPVEDARSRRCTRSASRGGTPAAAARLRDRARRLAEEAAGDCDDPYRAAQTHARDGVLYSRGNSALCALNLAYNGLTYASLLVLRRVLEAQAGGAGGLVRVRLEGNPLPAACADYAAVDALLERALAARLAAAAAARRTYKKSTSP